MEPALIAAYTAMLKAHPLCSVDRILCHPELRAEFLLLVRGDRDRPTEFDALHTLNNLRKRSKLPRRDECAGCGPSVSASV